MLTRKEDSFMHRKENKGNNKESTCLKLMIANYGKHQVDLENKKL